MMSLVPPGGSGTTRTIGRLGYVSAASPALAASSSATAAAIAASAAVWVTPSSTFFLPSCPPAADSRTGLRPDGCGGVTLAAIQPALSHELVRHSTEDIEG